MMYYPSLGGLSVVAALPSVGFLSLSVALAVLSVVAAFLSVAWRAFLRYSSSFRRFPLSIRRFGCSFRRCRFSFRRLAGFPSLPLFLPSPSSLHPSLQLFFPSLGALSVTSALLQSATIISTGTIYKPSLKYKKTVANSDLIRVYLQSKNLHIYACLSNC
ncbi:hypothetical protein [Lysinibacillus xylanilyticus]|uniref:hypothetical protein n=1 Tax=Lysinibacillus xylanilyticus TaxID=582475 RepID=UPI003CFE28C6